MANKFNSIFFVSLHKCATTLFTHKIIPKCVGYSQVDYQTAFYLDDAIVPDINAQNQVYGVIRVVDAEHPVYAFTQALLSAAGSGDYRVIILIRHPFDILVSMYFSFGFSHGLSPNPKLRGYQQRRREQVRKMTIDEYVLSEAQTLKAKFSELDKLRDKAQCTVIRYEDMVENYDDFYAELSSVLPLPADVRALLFSETRPNEVEDPLAHKRSGKVFAYRDKLAATTVRELNKEFEAILQSFSYTY